MPSSSATTCIAKSDTVVCRFCSSCSTGMSALRVRPCCATISRMSSCSLCCCPTSIVVPLSPVGQQLVDLRDQLIRLDRLLEEGVDRHQLLVLVVLEAGHPAHARQHQDGYFAPLPAQL